MPSGVPQHGHDDDQTPNGHRTRVADHHANRCPYRRAEPHVAVEQQRKRHDAYHQHQQGEEKTNADTDDNHCPTRAGGEHVASERADRGRRLRTKRQLVDRLGSDQPEEKDCHQHQAHHDDRAERARTDDAERVGPGDVTALLAAAAYFVETDRRERADEGEPGGEREQEWQHSIAEHQPRQNEADDRVDDTEEDDVGPVSSEVIETSGENLPQIGYTNAADLRERSLDILFGPDTGSASGPDDQTRKLDLICCPLDGVSDRHVCSSRTASSRPAGHRWQNTKSGLPPRESRDPSFTIQYRRMPCFLFARGSHETVLRTRRSRSAKNSQDNLA